MFPFIGQRWLLPCLAGLLTQPVFAEPAADQASQAQQGDKQVRIDRNGDPLPEGALARLGTIRLRQGGTVSSVSFFPDGKTLVSGGSNGALLGSSNTIGRVRIWDTATGKELRQFQLGGTAYVAVSPDGKVLAAADPRDGTVYLWEAASGKEIRRLQGLQGWNQMIAIAFSPDGKTLAVGSHDLNIWDVHSGQLLRRQRTGEPVFKLAFSPDSQTLAFSCVDGYDLRLQNVTTGDDLPQFKNNNKRGIVGVKLAAFCPDGKSIALYAGNSICIHDLATAKEVHRFPAPYSINTGFPPPRNASLTFSPDGKTLAVGSSRGPISLVEVAAGKECRSFTGHQESVTSLSFSADGQTLASGSRDGTIRLWDVATGKEIHPFPGHAGAVNGVALSPDGQTLISGGSDRTIRLWDVNTGKERQVLRVDQGAVASITLSPNGKLLASMNQRAGATTVRLWDLASAKEIHEFPPDRSSAAFSPDGKVLGVGGFNNKSQETVCLFDVTGGKELRQFKAYSSGPIPAWRVGDPPVLLFSPDGKTIATGSSWSYALWETDTGKQRRQLHDGRITGAAYPDSRTLVTASSIIRLWNVATGKEIRQLHGPESAVSVSVIALSPDGKTLASSYDQTIRLWEIVTGRARGEFEGHEGTIGSLCFSADGQTLASGSQDGTALIWDLTGFGKGQPPRIQLGQQELGALWTDLASADAGVAYRATWRWLAISNEAVPWLEKRLVPVAPLESKRLEKLLAELDSDLFAVRQKASDELEKLAELAQPALQKVLADKPALETRQRVEQLLALVENRVLSSDELRTWRALEVLERIGTPEAKQVLEKLAQGAPGHRITEEAQAALQRRRPAAP